MSLSCRFAIRTFFRYSLNFFPLNWSYFPVFLYAWWYFHWTMDVCIECDSSGNRILSLPQGWMFYYLSWQLSLCWGPSLRCRLEVFSDLLWACSFLQACALTFQLSPYIQLLSNVLVFNVWLSKGKKRKIKRGKFKIKGHQIVTPLKVILAWKGGSCNN